MFYQSIHVPHKTFLCLMVWENLSSSVGQKGPMGANKIINKEYSNNDKLCNK